MIILIVNNLLFQFQKQFAYLDLFKLLHTIFQINIMYFSSIIKKDILFCFYFVNINKQIFLFFIQIFILLFYLFQLKKKL